MIVMMKTNDILFQNINGKYNFTNPNSIMPYPLISGID